MNTQPETQFHLTETTVADIDGVRIGLGNIWEDEFTDSDGATHQKLRGTLAFMFDNEAQDFDRRVAIGDRFTIGNTRYQVTNIQEGQQLGSMTVERVIESQAAPTVAPQKSDFPWLDFMILLIVLGLPYIIEGQQAMAWTALGSLIIWFVVIKQTWFGLINFYGTLLLLLNLIGLTIFAIFW